MVDQPFRPSPGAHVIAAVSGGKDSTAMLLHLREIGIWPVRAVFYDTGWEHGATYAHLDLIEQRLGMPIERHAATVDLPAHLEHDARRIEAMMGVTFSAFVRLCLRKAIFPRRTVRFCTQELKIRPAQAIMRAAHMAGVVPVSCAGIRADESAARASMPETEISATLDCLVWHPILRWSVDDVIAIHARHDLPLNPLYTMGATRVGCFPCIMGNKAELRVVGNDTDRMEVARALEAAVAAEHQRRAEAKGETVAVAPTLFQAGRRNKAGERPGTPIDGMIAWARTARGAPILEPEDTGCMRAGLCERGE
jgi:3'-phosphoadenosine 5'-phosphosulfate sulfotransferase (PAPS reductase)/FAD synthetase